MVVDTDCGADLVCMDVDDPDVTMSSSDEEDDLSAFFVEVIDEDVEMERIPDPAVDELAAHLSRLSIRDGWRTIGPTSFRRWSQRVA